MLPISYGDAQPLLAALERSGGARGLARRAADHLSRRSGPGEGAPQSRFRLDIKPLYDVIATIPGITYPDQWVICGNHHDAWVNGASDPPSGASALLEEARALGALRKQGWQPKRTIISARGTARSSD